MLQPLESCWLCRSWCPARGWRSPGTSTALPRYTRSVRRYPGKSTALFRDKNGATPLHMIPGQYGTIQLHKVSTALPRYTRSVRRYPATQGHYGAVPGQVRRYPLHKVSTALSRDKYGATRYTLSVRRYPGTSTALSHYTIQDQNGAVSGWLRGYPGTRIQFGAAPVQVRAFPATYGQ